MTIKGHAKIELTDVHNGGKEVIESDNIVTNGAANFMKPLGCSYYNRFNGFSDPLVTTLYGGLILWDGNIEEDVNKYAKPSNVSMVGNAYYGYKNVSDVTELGSYNASESEVASDHVKFVYDFATNEGNGEIACLSLVHKSTGMIGFGNKNGRYINYSSSMVSGTGLLFPSNCRYVCIDTDDSSFIYVYDLYDSNAQSRYIEIKKATDARLLSNVSLFSNSKVLSTKDIKFSDFCDYTSYSYGYSFNQHYLYVSVFNNNTEEITICTINIKTGEIVSTKKTDALKSQGFNPQSSMDLLYSNNCIFVSQYSAASKILNIDTGKIVDCKGFALYDRASYTINDKESFVFDNSRNTTYIFNSERMDLRNINYVYYDSHDDSRHFYSGENGDMYNYSKGFSRNPFYLGTINNLGTPVTKTADKTMKITYTLTEA